MVMRSMLLRNSHVRAFDKFFDDAWSHSFRNPFAVMDKVNCPIVKSVGWLVESDDPIKIAGTLDEEGNPCAILAIPRGCVLELPEVSIYEHPKQPTNIC